ncbi:hypothetical protein ACFQ1B_35185 [Streptomyces mexicanus]
MSNRPLRIAMVAPPWFELPPRGYGGIEAMCADLTDALVERGHDVTLIAAGRNGTRAHRMLRTYDLPQGPRLGEPLPEVLHAAPPAGCWTTSTWTSSTTTPSPVRCSPAAAGCPRWSPPTVRWTASPATTTATSATACTWWRSRSRSAPRHPT